MRDRGARPSGRSGSYLVRPARIGLFVTLAVAALMFAVCLVRSLSHRYALDYGEAPVLDQAMRLASGENLYRSDLSVPPFTVTNYPPLYPIVVAPVVAVTGATFAVGRAVSGIAALATAVFLALIVHVHTRARLAAVTTGLMFLAIPLVTQWSSLARVDLLALAASTGGLYLLVRTPKDVGLTGRALVAPAVCLVAAVYTRQSYALAAPLAAVAWIAGRDRRRAVVFAALVAGAAVALAVVVQVVSGGGFLHHVITANRNPYSVDRLAWFLGRFVSAAGVLVLVGGVYAIFAPASARASVVTAYLVGATVSALAIGKVGSNVNYLLELSAALAMATGMVIAWSRDHRFAHVALLVVLAVQTVRMVQVTRAEVLAPLERQRDQIEELRALEQLVAGTPGPVLADEHMGMLVLQRRPIVLQPFEMTQLARAGEWDQTPLVDRIRRQELALILIYQPTVYPIERERWTPEMLAAVHAAYRDTAVLADTHVYRPVGAQP